MLYFRLVKSIFFTCCVTFWEIFPTKLGLVGMEARIAESSLDGDTIFDSNDDVFSSFDYCILNYWEIANGVIIIC